MQSTAENKLPKLLDILTKDRNSDANSSNEIYGELQQLFQSNNDDIFNPHEQKDAHEALWPIIDIFQECTPKKSLLCEERKISYGNNHLYLLYHELREDGRQLCWPLELEREIKIVYRD